MRMGRNWRDLGGLVPHLVLPPGPPRSLLVPDPDDEVRRCSSELLKAELTLEPQDIQRIKIQVPFARPCGAEPENPDRLDAVRLQRRRGVDVRDDPHRGLVQRNRDPVVVRGSKGESLLTTRAGVLFTGGLGPRTRGETEHAQAREAGQGEEATTLHRTLSIGMGPPR